MTHSTTRPSLIISIIGMALLAVNMRAPIVALGSIAPNVQEALDINQTQIGWLGSIPVMMFALGAFIAPILHRKFALNDIIIASILVLIFGIIIRVIIPSWTLFLIGTLLLSLAIGFTNTLASPAIKDLTPNHIPQITGMLSLTMTVVAGLAAGLVLPITNFVGWQWALGGWAIFSMFALFVWIQIRNQACKSENLKEKENSDKNLPHIHQDNEAVLETSLTMNVWKIPMAWFLAVFMGIQSLSYYTVASFLPSIWIDKGLTPISAGNMATIFQMMAPASIIILTMMMSNRKLIPVIAIFAAVCNAVSVAGMIFFTADLAWLWSGLLGFGGSIIFTLAIMLMSMRTYTTEQASSLSGMTQTVGYFIAIVGPIGTGWLHEQTGSWNVPLNILFALMLVNLVFSYLASRPMMIDGQLVNE